MTLFSEKVWKIVAEIPAGKTLTYKEVAKMAGNDKASRAVGWILASNINPQKYPCHRVVRSDGRIGGYRWGIKRKKKLLEKEGFKFDKI